MTRITRIELAKENFKFSAGHFTIFSATERENIHGHNFTVAVAFDAIVEENGRTFDYGLAKQFIEKMCKAHNEYFLVPEKSNHLKINEENGYVTLQFGVEKIPFLKRDVKFLPIENVTIEDLSLYLLDLFRRDFIDANRFPITAAEVRVFSGPGQSANATWSAA